MGDEELKKLEELSRNIGDRSTLNLNILLPPYIKKFFVNKELGIERLEYVLSMQIVVWFNNKKNLRAIINEVFPEFMKIIRKEAEEQFGDMPESLRSLVDKILNDIQAKHDKEMKQSEEIEVGTLLDMLDKDLKAK